MSDCFYFIYSVIYFYLSNIAFSVTAAAAVHCFSVSVLCRCHPTNVSSFLTPSTLFRHRSGPRARVLYNRPHHPFAVQPLLLLTLSLLTSALLAENSRRYLLLLLSVFIIIPIYIYSSLTRLNALSTRSLFLFFAVVFFFCFFINPPGITFLHRHSALASVSITHCLRFSSRSLTRILSSNFFLFFFIWLYFNLLSVRLCFPVLRFLTGHRVCVSLVLTTHFNRSRHLHVAFVVVPELVSVLSILLRVHKREHKQKKGDIIVHSCTYRKILSEKSQSKVAILEPKLAHLPSLKLKQRQ